MGSINEDFKALLDKAVMEKIAELSRAKYKEQYYKMKANDVDKFNEYKKKKNANYYEKHKEELKRRRLEKKEYQLSKL